MLQVQLQADGKSRIWHTQISAQMMNLHQTLQKLNQAGILRHFFNSKSTRVCITINSHRPYIGGRPASFAYDIAWSIPSKDSYSNQLVIS